MGLVTFINREMIEVYVDPEGVEEVVETGAESCRIKVGTIGIDLNVAAGVVADYIGKERGRPLPARMIEAEKPSKATKKTAKS